jgi:hypothetical protein
MLRISIASCVPYSSVKAPSRKFLVYLEGKLPSATFPLQRAGCVEKLNTHSWGGGISWAKMERNKVKSVRAYIRKHQCEGGYLIFVVPARSGYFKKPEQRTVSSRYLEKASEPKNLWVFEKIRIKEPSVPGISKTSKKLMGFVKEPAKTLVALGGHYYFLNFF